MNEQEKITDIITEKRLQADKLEKDLAQIDQSRVPLNIVTEMRMFIDSWRLEADRLEAAHKRERGNCAKLRVPLETLRELLGDLLRLEDANYHNDFLNFCDIIDAALAATEQKGGNDEQK